MGTSRSTSGPKSPAWTAAKTAATHLAKQRPGATPRKVVRHTARALGGSGGGGGGGAWSRGGVRTAQRLGGLLGAATDVGINETARQFGIGDLEGRAAGDAIMDILDWVADTSDDLDEQTARRAAEAVLSGLVRDDVALDVPLDIGAAMAMFQSFVVQYITRTIIVPLSARLTENAPASEARQYEREIERVVEALVELDIPPEQFPRIDWLGSEGAETFKRIRDDALDLLADDDP